MGLRVAANVTLMFPDLALRDRIGAAARAGFDGVECLFPYDLPASAMAAALRDAGLPLALINTPEPDWPNARGCAAIPGMQATFRARFGQARDYARATGAQAIHVMSGNTDDPRAFDTAVDNLRWACAQAPDLTLTAEPLNPRDMPGYWLADFDTAARLIAAVGAPNLSLQFDAWHAQRIGGDALAIWQGLAAPVGHVQIAGLAARGTPDPAAPDEAALLRAIAARHDGWLACEYLCVPGDRAAWLPALRTAMQGMADSTRRGRL